MVFIVGQVEQAGAKAELLQQIGQVGGARDVLK